MRESRDGVLENPGHVAYVRDVLRLQNTVPYKTRLPDAASPPLLSLSTLWAVLADEARRWERHGAFGSAWAHLASFICGALTLYLLPLVGSSAGVSSPGGGKQGIFSPKPKSV